MEWKRGLELGMVDAPWGLLSGEKGLDGVFGDTFLTMVLAVGKWDHGPELRVSTILPRNKCITCWNDLWIDLGWVGVDIDEVCSVGCGC